MLQRTLSAGIALLIILPLFFIGGFVFKIAIYILAVIGLWEFLKMKCSKKELPIFIDFISYIVLTFFILFNQSTDALIFTIDNRIIVGLFFVFLIPTVLYHNQDTYDIVDAFYLVGGIFFLGTSFAFLIALRDYNLWILLYLFLITAITDTYAYLVGKLIGKNKLLTSISPNKTWEGTIGGTFFGVLVATIFYHLVIDSNLSLTILIAMTLFLSILGQFGDLVFSSIKRYYEKKDFSSIIPGHGGILDRLDSLIFVVLGFIFFLSIL